MQMNGRLPHQNPASHTFAPNGAATAARRLGVVTGRRAEQQQRNGVVVNSNQMHVGNVPLNQQQFNSYSKHQTTDEWTPHMNAHLGAPVVVGPMPGYASYSGPEMGVPPIGPPTHSLMMPDMNQGWGLGGAGVMYGQQAPMNAVINPLYAQPQNLYANNGAVMPVAQQYPMYGSHQMISHPPEDTHNMQHATSYYNNQQKMNATMKPHGPRGGMTHHSSLLTGLDAIETRMGGLHFNAPIDTINSKLTPQESVQNVVNESHSDKRPATCAQSTDGRVSQPTLTVPPPSGPLLKPCCDYCSEPILDDECTEAEGKVFHLNHFCCRECGRALGGLHYIMSEPNKASAETDDNQTNETSTERNKSDDGSHAYCLTCYDILFGELCEECGELIGCDVGSISHEKRSWHAWPQCFRCNTCNSSLLGHPFLPANDGKIYCSLDCSRQAKELRTKRARESLRKRQQEQDQEMGSVSGGESRGGTLTRPEKKGALKQAGPPSPLDDPLQLISSSGSNQSSGIGSSGEFASLPTHSTTSADVVHRPPPLPPRERETPPPLPLHPSSQQQHQSHRRSYSSSNLLCTMPTASGKDLLRPLRVAVSPMPAAQPGLHTDSSDGVCEELATPSGANGGIRLQDMHQHREAHSGTDSTDSACITTPTNFSKRVSTPTQDRMDSISPPPQFDQRQVPPTQPPPPPPQSPANTPTPTSSKSTSIVGAKLKEGVRGRGSTSGGRAISIPPPPARPDRHNKDTGEITSRPTSRSNSIPSLHCPMDSNESTPRALTPSEQMPAAKRSSSKMASQEKLNSSTQSVRERNVSSRSHTPTASIAHSSTSSSSSSTVSSAQGGPRTSSATQTTPTVKQVSFSPSTKATSSHRVVHRRHSRRHSSGGGHHSERHHYEYRHGHRHGHSSHHHGYSATMKPSSEYSRRKRRPAAHDYNYEPPLSDEAPIAGPSDGKSHSSSRKSRRRPSPLPYYSDPETCSTCSSTCSSCTSSSDDDGDDNGYANRTRANQWYGGTHISYVPATLQKSAMGSAGPSGGGGTCSVKSSMSDLNQVVTMSAKTSGGTLTRKSKSKSAGDPNGGEACSLM